MAKNIMSLSTINTILNTAPLVIQGATRLIKLIKDQGDENKSKDEIPETIEGIKNEVERLHERLDMNNESNVEQIKLIEELAKQNESLAAQLKSSIAQINKLTLLVTIAIALSLIALMFAVLI